MLRELHESSWITKTCTTPTLAPHNTHGTSSASRKSILDFPNLEHLICDTMDDHLKTPNAPPPVADIVVKELLNPVSSTVSHQHTETFLKNSETSPLRKHNTIS
tara:strand:+ start:825 stop:1136 length:312 start_codon:yes stop_codon:yes gene_type:complete